MQNFSICSASEVETNPLENTAAVSTLLSQAKIDGDRKFPGNTLKFLFDFPVVSAIFAIVGTFSWETGLLTIAIFLKIGLFYYVSLCITCVCICPGRGQQIALH